MPKLPPLEIKGREPDDPAIVLALNDFASTNRGCAYGRIFMIKKDFDHRGDLYYLRLYNEDTGRPMICPDSRCRNSRNHHTINFMEPARATQWPPVCDGCVICTMTGSRDRFSKYTPDDIAFFRQEGMINGE